MGLGALRNTKKIQGLISKNTTNATVQIYAMPNKAAKNLIAFLEPNKIASVRRPLLYLLLYHECC